LSGGAPRRPGEFSLIDAFLAPFELDRGGVARRSYGVLCGPGDDCAALRVRPGMQLVATTDAVLDGVHFDLARQSPEDAGYKALAVNLSDLAAAGARPRWLLCALGVPPPQPRRPSERPSLLASRMARGMAHLARRSRCALVGGNVSKAAQWSLTITALGEASRPLSRAGGRPGDLLVLSGMLGGAALGLRELLARQPGRPLAPRFARAGPPDPLRAQLCPTPLVDAGLAAAPIASAAIDLSDGLLQDLGHLCARSGVGAVVDCALLPRLPAVARAEATSARSGAHPYALSLAGGEDYALLFAVRPRRLGALLAALGQAGSPGCPIGRLVREKGIGLEQAGRRLPLPPQRGHDHLG
jgi:thiamine-monophosphate kinase